ncbi:C-type mannose receptor 2-like isoform X1 [Trematomus bernacchii]|uniref:C-type mannose receptor 2-like isoform X1 n=1 Tax=Trematomus bernacchii TaxID=40690 RepID=UPI00146D6408|nr:C-type mannose receptor 2-like isoform X1 [Trematomus bernacchii]
MQWSLFVLILMGQCSFFTCDLYEYHFIQEEKSWEEAQSYCRENYTDLATVSDMRDVKRLTNPPQTTDAWIGLRSISRMSWHWSLPGVEFKESETEWETGQPDNGVTEANCVVIKEQKWHDWPCKNDRGFICYNEPNQTYHSIVETKNWLEAQSYCREHHTDLVSGFKQMNSTQFKETIETVSNPDNYLWIGLFRDTWSWSDGKNFSFRHWEDSFEDVPSKTCAVTTKPNGKWSSDTCTNKKPFYCYDVPDKVILIKEKKTWDEALTYCRENHRDLVSITDSHQQRWVQERAKMADTEFVWLGMRYTCTLDLWLWVIDRLVCYDHWATDQMDEQCGMAGVMERDGEWYKKPDHKKFNFICAK